MKWGVTCQRWGRHYDHGLVSCRWKCRVRSKRVHERPLDYSPLENKDNGALREHFDECVRTHLDNSLCDPDNASAGLARLTKCITAAAHKTLQVKQTLRKRNVSARTKQLYESRRRHFTTLSENERKEMSNAISKSGREDYREYVNGVLNDIEAAERVGNMREISLNLSHKCSACAREFTKQRGLRIHMARWCDGGLTQRSRVGTLTDKAVKTAKRRAAEATLGTVEIDNNVLGNVYSFEYLGSRLQGDGDDEADVRYRMDIAQAAFASLSHLWTDHRLSRNLKLRLYNLCVCSTLTHSCEAWNLTKTVSQILNGFNSRCLHIITGEEYRVTAVSPAYNLLLSVRQRRLRYLGHLLRLPHDSFVRRTLILSHGGWRQPLPRRELLHGLPGFTTERP